MSKDAGKIPAQHEYWEVKHPGFRFKKKMRVFIGYCNETWCCLVEESGNLVVCPSSTVLQQFRYLPGCDSFSWEEPKFPPTESLQEILEKLPLCEDYPARYQEIPTEQEHIDSLVADLEQKRIDVAAGDSFPQYWTVLSGDGAYVLQMTPDHYVLVRKDGTQSPVRPWRSSDAQFRRLLTEAEAMALLDKPIEAEPIPEATVEDADPLVVQNRETVREGIDEIRWSTWPAGHWEKATYRFNGKMHGCKNGTAVLSVRCNESKLPYLTVEMLHREVRPFEELPSLSEDVFPSNQQLFEAVANLRDQMDRMSKKSPEQQRIEACVSLRIPASGNASIDDLIETSVRRDIAVAFATGSLAFSPGLLGRSDLQESNQLADLPNAAVAFADDMLKKLGFTK